MTTKDELIRLSKERYMVTGLDLLNVAGAYTGSEQQAIEIMLRAKRNPLPDEAEFYGGVVGRNSAVKSKLVRYWDIPKVDDVEAQLNNLKRACPHDQVGISAMMDFERCRKCGSSRRRNEARLTGWDPWTREDGLLP